MSAYRLGFPHAILFLSVCRRGMPTEERIITISPSAIFRAVATLFALVFLWAIREVIALIFVALMLSAVMTPFVALLRKFKIPVAVSVLLFYAVLFGGILSTLVLLVPQLLSQMSHLGTSLGASWKVALNGASAIQDFSIQYGLQENVQAAINSLETTATAMIGSGISKLTGAIGGVTMIVIVLVLAYYMSVEQREAFRILRHAIPSAYRSFADDLLGQVRKKFGHWLVGQLALSFIVGVFSYIGLRILGVEGALLLSIFAGFAEFIPYLGPILSGLFVFIVALAQSPFMAVCSLALMVLIQQVENHILVPKIMQKAVGLSPVVSIIALLVGAKLFGFAGVILAIPFATAVSVAITEWIRYRHPPFDQHASSQASLSTPPSL